MIDILNQLFSTLVSIFPRLVVIRSTHAGIRFRRGKIAMPMQPGLHIFWPLFTEVDVRVTARQTNTLAPQSLTTKDGVGVVVGAYIVFYINDILAACETNWDIDNTIDDIARSAVVEIVTASEYKDLRDNLSVLLTRVCRKKLKPFGVGVKRAGVTDLVKCRTLRLLGGIPVGIQ